MEPESAAIYAVTDRNVINYSCMAHLPVTVAYMADFEPDRDIAVCILPVTEERSCWGHAMNWPLLPELMQRKGPRISEHGGVEYH